VSVSSSFSSCFLASLLLSFLFEAPVLALLVLSLLFLLLASWCVVRFLKWLTLCQLPLIVISVAPAEGDWVAAAAAAAAAAASFR
jgi:hypothetical protein